MEFLEQIAPEIKLTPEQVTAIKTKGTEYINSQKSAWEKDAETKYSQIANQNAESILSDVAKGVETITGIKREDKVKYADYLKQATELHFTGKEKSLNDLKQKYEQLIKDGDKSGAVKAKLEEVEQQLDAFKQKAAIYDEYEKEDYKGKYLNLQKELNTQKEQNAFNSVRPAFSDKLNKYEVAAKWDEFMNTIKKEYTIEIVDNKPVAINKENNYKTVPLSELVEKDTGISELLKAQTGSQGTGGAGNIKTVKVDGLPFELPENPTSEQKTEAIRKHLEGKGLNKVHADYAKQFGELMKKINESIKKA